MTSCLKVLKDGIWSVRHWVITPSVALGLEHIPSVKRRYLLHQDVGYCAVKDAGEACHLVTTWHLLDDLVRTVKDTRLEVLITIARRGHKSMDRIPCVYRRLNIWCQDCMHGGDANLRFDLTPLI